MDNFSRMFNKSFNDLSFLQNISNTNDKFVFVFDFDMTLTAKSSDGMTKKMSNYIELFDSENKLGKLKYYLEKIFNSGNIIYINTRALSSHVAHILKNVNIEVGDTKLIKSIKGSTRIEQITNPFNALLNRSNFNLNTPRQTMNWNVGNVRNMNFMFNGAFNFVNVDIRRWIGEVVHQDFVATGFRNTIWMG